MARLRPSVFWSGLLGLLVLEFVLFAVAFQGRALLFDATWWRDGFYWQAQVLTWVATAAVTGLVIFWTAQLGQPRVSLRERLRHPRLVWPLLIVHLLGFVLLGRITLTITAQNLQHSPISSAYWVLWFGAGLFVLLTWIAAVLPGTGSGIVLASAVAGLAAWLGGGGSLQLYDAWKRAAFNAAAMLLRLIFPDVVAQPETDVLGTSRFQVHMGPGCSGCEGIGLVWVAIGLYLWCYRSYLRWPQALVLLPVGTVLVWAANILRIALLIAIGVWISPQVGLGGFHSEAGWITFNLITLGLIAVSQRSRFLARRESVENQVDENPAAPYLAPVLVLVAITMVTAALSEDFDALYPLRVVLVGGVLLLFRRTYAQWSWGWSWSAAGFGAAAFAIWMGLEFYRGVPNDSPMGLALRTLPTFWAGLWLAFRVVGSVVTVPLAEELGFRGYLLRRLVAADFRSVSPGQITWLAVIVSSALFGLLHGRWLAGMLAGLLYALALRHRGRVADAVLAHAVTNALIAAYVLTTGAWALWQ